MMLLRSLSSSSLVVCLLTQITVRAQNSPPPLEDGDLITVALSSETPALLDVPDAFVGFGLFYSNLPGMMGGRPNRLNPDMVALVERLAQHQGSVPFRFGGGSVSETWYDPGNAAQPQGIQHNLTNDLLDAVELFLETSGSEALFGLNASVEVPGLFEDMANGILSRIDEDKIIAFELGNEPNRYEPNGRRPSGYDFDDMIVESDEFVTKFETLVNTTKPIVGPTLTLFRGSPEDDEDWTLRLPEYVDEFSDRVGAITQNRYPMSDCTTNPSSIRFASIENMLDDTSSIRQGEIFADLIEHTQDAGLPFWINEHNTASCGGTDGSSNSYASALWFLDATFAWAAAGVEKVYVPFIRSGFYAPFISSEDLSDPSNFGNWTTEVMPVFYGMELFAQAAGTGRELLENIQETDSNARAWTTRDEAGFHYVLLINKDLDDSGMAKVQLPGSVAEASAVRLLSPSADAMSGITLAGQTWDGSTNGFPNGTPTSESILPDSNGIYQLNLPAFSAALLTIPPLDTSNIIIARPNVAATALTGQTLLLDGSDSFGENLSYEWEQISGPELDITSQSESLAAATFSSSGSYRFRLTVDNDRLPSQSAEVTVFVSDTSENFIFTENNGAFAFEAENFSNQTEGTGNFANHQWVVDTDSAANEGQFVRVTPSESQRDREGTEAPALEYELFFETAGTWSVQVRMLGPDADSDSLHIGLESPTTGLNGIRQRETTWEWTGEIPGEGQATIQVASPGPVTFRVWPREDGVYLDRIALSLDPNADFSAIPDSPLLTLGDPVEIYPILTTEPSRLSWDSVPATRYLIEGTSTLGGDWVIEGIEEAQGSELVFPLPAPTGQKFFRIKEL